MKLVAIAALSWAGISGVGLWQYIYRYSLPASPPSQLSRVPPHELLSATDGTKIELGDGAPITLLDFTSADCGCSQFLVPYIDRLSADYSKRGIRFVHVLESAEQPSQRGISVSDPHGVVAHRFGVGATPGAVIVDSNGTIVFSGAYNRARFCDDRDSDFAELALEAVLSGKKPAIARTPFFGCAVPKS